MATFLPERNFGGSGRITPSAKPRSTMLFSICLIVTAGSLMPSTQAASHGAGQIRPVKCLRPCRHGNRLTWNMRLASGADTQHSLEFVAEDFDEARQRLHAVRENVLCALAPGQLGVAFEQAAGEFYVTRFDDRL